MDDVTTKFLRLQNGDDIVTPMVEIDDDNGLMYLLINPLKILYMQSEKNGSLQLAFMPWVFPKVTASQEFTIMPEDVLLISIASEKMNKYYWENLEYYMNMFEGKDETPTVDPEPEHDESEHLDNILEMIKSAKRTYH